MYPGMDDSNPGPRLPDGVSEQQVNDLIRELFQATELIGLYAHPQVGVEMLPGFDADQPEKRELFLNVAFRIGKVAFTKRVQDPEQDDFDNSFRQIDTMETHSKVEDIKNRFRKKNDGPENP